MFFIAGLLMIFNSYSVTLMRKYCVAIKNIPALMSIEEGGQTWRKIHRSGHLRGRPLPSSGKETAEEDDNERTGLR